MTKFEIVSFPQYAKDVIGVPLEDMTQEQKEQAMSCYRNIRTPMRSTEQSAGYDFVCPVETTIPHGWTATIHTGIRCSMKSNQALLLLPRSSLGMKHHLMLSNTVGLIDPDYFFAQNEGHIVAKLVNLGNETVVLKPGDRFVQGIIINFSVTDDDVAPKTSRTGGMGSTGA